MESRGVVSRGSVGVSLSCDIPSFPLQGERRGSAVESRLASAGEKRGLTGVGLDCGQDGEHEHKHCQHLPEAPFVLLLVVETLARVPVVAVIAQGIRVRACEFLKQNERYGNHGEENLGGENHGRVQEKEPPKDSFDGGSQLLRSWAKHCFESPPGDKLPSIAVVKAAG